MATITVTPGHTYGTTDTVTSTNLNDLGSPTAALTAGSILTADIADANVTTAKIADANVTFAKLTDVIDDDTMATATDTTLATSESIKAYTDTRALNPTREYNSFSHSTASETIIENTTGRPLWVSFTCITADNLNYLLLDISPNSDMSAPTRIAQSRIYSDGSITSGAQVCGIVPSGWYWEVIYSGNAAFSEQVHCSFAL